MSAQQSSYDVVIIGTSPLAITEAIYQKSQGKSVLNIDNRSDIGGAWTTIKHDGIPDVEIGCHIWEVEKSTTNFLSSFFNLSLEPLRPSPRLFKKRLSIPYDWKMNLSTSKYIFSKLGRFKFKELKAGMKSPARRFTIVPSKYLYPKGGAKALHLSVLQKVKEFDLKSRLNCSVESVQVSNDGCQLSLNKGEDQITCKRLILTSLSAIERVEFEDGTSIVPTTKKVDYIHLHLLVNGNIPKAFSYHRLMDDEIIHRVSDMTLQVKDEIVENQHLICAGLHSNAYHNSTQEELVKAVIDKLIDRKLLSPDAKVDAHGFNVFPSYYNDPTMLSEIEDKSKGKIYVLRSTSLTFAFHNRLKDYETLV